MVAVEKHGEWTWWYSNGQKLAEGHYLNNAPVGKWVYWHANGQKQMEGEYENGAQTGKWVSWNPDGTILRVEEFAGQEQWAVDNKDSADAAIPEALAGLHHQTVPG